MTAAWIACYPGRLSGFAALYPTYASGVLLKMLTAGLLHAIGLQANREAIA
jgi:hypothetical protein